MNDLNKNSGIAVIICLSVVSILIFTVFEIHKTVRSHVFSTAVLKDNTTLTYMATSGIHAVIAMLVKDRNDTEIDSMQEDWANPEKIKELLSIVSFEEGQIEVSIVDLRGLVPLNAIVIFPEGRNVNNAQMFLWERFLTSMISDEESYNEIDPRTIITSMKDWLDSGDDDAITGLSGAESDYYQELVPPYACRNGRFTHKNELLMVKGITPELFYGINGQPGISQYITIYGMTGEGNGQFTFNGKININTAPPPVLAAILPSDHTDLAQEIFDYREERSGSAYMHDLSDPAWYKNVPGCSDLKIDPNLITNSSDLFQITSSATLSNRQMTVSAIVKRDKNQLTGQWTCRILSWIEA